MADRNSSEQKRPDGNGSEQKTAAAAAALMGDDGSVGKGLLLWEGENVQERKRKRRFMMLREDFCLISGFRFGKVNLDPKEEDHSEFHNRVFPKIANLKGEHLFELIKKDVEFNQLDDEDVIWGLETFSNSIYWWRKDENVIPRGVAWSNGLKFEKSVIRLARRGSCNSKSVHTRVQTEVRHEVHVRTEVHRFVNKEQEINDMQRCLLSLEQLTKQLNIRQSDVDHLDKNGNGFENVVVGGLDHQSMKGVSQCMNVDHLEKNWNDVFENFPIDDLDHQSVAGVRQCTSVDHVDKVTELMKDIYNTHSGPTCVQDVGVLDSMDVDKPSLVNNVLGDVHVDSVVKDVDENDVQTVVVPYQREKKLSKACLSPYVPPPSTTEVKCKRRRRNNNKKKQKKNHQNCDGNEIQLLPWKEDLTRSPSAPKRTVSVPKEIMSLFRDKKKMEMRKADDDLAMASPYLSDMLLRWEFPSYYADGVKYGVAWFASSVEKDFHWCLAELHLRLGVITFYDSLGGPSDGIEAHLFWLELRQTLEFHIPLYMDDADVFEKKNIDKDKLSHYLPLEVDDSINVALAYHERMIEFLWKYKMLV
ncbi:hypothetical protein Tco_0469834 [Tanacetum coccineum]